MGERLWSAGGGALFLTALSCVSQLLGFAYRVALSRLVGAEVMGLYQLLMPVYSVLLSLTAVGLTSAVSNLTARHMALGDRSGAGRTLSLCLRAFFLALLPVGAAVIAASDAISVWFLGDARTQLGLILLVPCVALTGVENCHKHFFYGAGLVGAAGGGGAAGAAGANPGGAGSAAGLPAPVPGAGGGAHRGGHGALRGVLRLHPGGPVPPADGPARPGGPGERRGPAAAGGGHRPAGGLQRPVGQPAGGGQFPPHPPEAGGGRPDPVPGRLPVRGWCAA